MKKQQQGAALMMALVILLIMTLIGLSALQTSSLDMKIAANKQEKVAAYHIAETGLELAFEHSDINLLDVENYSYTAGPGTLGMAGSTVSMTIERYEPIPEEEETALDNLKGAWARQSDHGSSPYGTSTHAASAQDWVMTANARRPSRAGAVHRRAFRTPTPR